MRVAAVIALVALPFAASWRPAGIYAYVGMIRCRGRNYAGVKVGKLGGQVSMTSRMPYGAKSPPTLPT